MQRVITHRLAGLGLAGLIALATAGGAVATFTAGGPGENMRPTNEADHLISLVQSQDSVLWTSLAGNVSVVKALGWPSSDGAHDLGGALMMETPSNPTAGTMNLAEKPMSVEFELEN